MTLAAEKPKQTANVYRQATVNFYAEERAKNHGRLPPDLIGPDGRPRELTQSPKDRKYREEWLKQYKKAARPAAGPPNKLVQPCQVPVVSVLQYWPFLSLLDKIMEPPPPPVKPHHPPCNLAGVTVQCEHFGSGQRGEMGDQKRTFKLTVKPGDKVNALGVIGKSSDKISCTIEGIAGPCSSHRSHVVSLYPADHVETRTDSKAVFEAIPPSLSEVSPLHYIWPSKLESHRYALSASTCDHALHVYVDVYPKVWWTAKLGIKKEASYDTASERRDPLYAGKAEYKINGELKADLGSLPQMDLLSIEYSKASHNCFKLLLTTLEILDHAESFCDKVASAARKTGVAGRFAPKVTFDKPGFSAEGSWGWKELEKRPECAFSWEIKVGFTPIIGADVTIDAVPWLLSAWPAFSALVSKSGDDDHFFVAIDLTLGGKVSVTFNSEGNSVAPKEGKTELDLKGQVSLELVGRLHVGYKYIGISVSAEGKLGAKATIGGDLAGGQDEEGGYVSGKFSFEGLVGYACWEAGFEVDWFDDDKRRDDAWSKKDDHKLEGGRRDEDGCLLMGKKEWPLFKKRFAESE